MIHFQVFFDPLSRVLIVVTYLRQTTYLRGKNNNKKKLISWKGFGFEKSVAQHKVPYVVNIVAGPAACHANYM